MALSTRLAFTILAVVAIVSGILVGLVSAGFIQLVDMAIRAILASSWFKFQYTPLILCSLGGILVGLCQRFLGDHPKNFVAALNELVDTGRLDYTQLPRGLVLATVSLIFGGSLGPEAVIVNLLGGLSTRAADYIRPLRMRMRIPAPVPEVSRLHILARTWPNLVVVLVGLIAFGIGVEDLYVGGLLNMTEPFSWIDVLWAIPLSLIGWLFGSLYLLLFRRSQKLTSRFESFPVLRSVIAGVVLGLLASWLPMMLYSGQFDMQPTYLQAGQLGSTSLVLIALLRIVVIALLLASGWKGGQFFPLMFAATALGMGLNQALPFISAPAGILGIMTGLMVITLPQPVVVFVMMAYLFQSKYLLIIIVSILTVSVSQMLLKRLPRRVSGIHNQQKEA